MKDLVIADPDQVVALENNRQSATNDPLVWQLKPPEMSMPYLVWGTNNMNSTTTRVDLWMRCWNNAVPSAWLSLDWGTTMMILGVILNSGRMMCCGHRIIEAI